MDDLLNAPSLPLVRDPGDLEVVLIADAGQWSARREALPGQFGTHVVSVIPHRELEGQLHPRIIAQEDKDRAIDRGQGARLRVDPNEEVGLG
jgi:hypothetical protein